MGMSTHIVGFVPPDEKWKKMKAVWDACKLADITPPDEVLAFFNEELPDYSGVEVELKGCQIDTRIENCDVWEYNLDTIREKYPNVKSIRFSRC